MQQRAHVRLVATSEPDHVRGGLRDLRAGCRCDRYLRLRQHRRIVHAVAEHRHHRAVGLQPAHEIDFRLR